MTLPRTHDSALERAIDSLRNDGLGTFAYKLASEVGFRRVLLLERRLDAPIPDVAPAVAVEFVLLGEGDVGDYLALRPDADHARVAAQLASGWSCYALKHGGRIVSACWRADPPYWSSYLERVMPVGEGDAYLTDAWTDAGYRGQALAQVLCLHQLRHLRAAGYRRALRGTVPENRSALRAHAKSGFHPIEVLGRIRIGPWRRHFRREWRDA